VTEHFIPFRKSDVIAACAGDGRLSATDQVHFRQFAGILAATFHFEFHREIDALKDVYAPLDPNRDTRDLVDTGAMVTADRERALLERLGGVLTKANYQRVDPEELARAMTEESVFRVKLDARLDDFAQLVLFARGSRTAKETRKGWFGKRIPFDVAYYERVVLYARFKDAASFDPKRLKKATFSAGSTILKLFQNIPKADLEMLLPNTEVRMRTTDKAMIMVPAVAGGVLALMKVATSLLLLWTFLWFWLGIAEKPSGELNKPALVALGLGLFAFSVHVFRQVGRYKNRKIQFMKALSDSLYFKNLDNNAGVFHRVIDDAEEEEVKEAVLAYYFLLVAGRELTAAALDAAIEGWFAAKHGTTLDFEVADGLAKLERLGLASRSGDAWRALPLPQAKAELDRRWDGFFAFA
jgi:hypothetical protein